MGLAMPAAAPTSPFLSPMTGARRVPLMPAREEMSWSLWPPSVAKLMVGWGAAADRATITTTRDAILRRDIADTAGDLHRRGGVIDMNRNSLSSSVDKVEIRDNRWSIDDI